MEALSILYDIPFWPVLRYDNLTTDFTNLVPIQFLKKYVMVPIEENNQISDTENSLSQNDGQNAATDVQTSACIIAINDPVAFQPLDDLVRVIGLDMISAGILQNS